MKRYIFLLGGWDLEMITIRKILQKRGYMYYDNHLSWNNANLSSYINILSQYGNQPGYIIVGIELVGVTDYKNYVSIDHHNQLDQLPSSIEQLTNLLNMELSHFYQVVAANDKGYIPAMQIIGANSITIKRIRALDRHFQGITASDEQLAQKSLTHVGRVGKLMVVESYGECFSPICDALFPYSDLLIYTDNQWVYYGSKKEEISIIFQSLISNHQAYYGGGRNGFIGIKTNSCTSKEIKIQIKQIIHLFQS